jgi:hypothetical protein
MTPEQFCYWLQGRAELQPDNTPTAEEWKSICEHLQTVFHKVTPPVQIAPMPYPMPNESIPSWKQWRTECKVQGGHAIATC